jgi:8-oxo-dGTP pyrophosphatase MutT (NUDIX family)
VIHTLDALAAAFEGHEPALHADAARTQAAVALVVSEHAGDLTLLFIERAHHEDDRWSGDIAFPGGRVDPEDADPAGTAVRETLEEVGVSLEGRAPIARLDDLVGYRESVLVSGFVYAVAGRPDLHPNHEVANAFWLPLREIESPERQVMQAFDYRGSELVLPGLRVDPARPGLKPPVLWGLSYRFLEILMERCGRPIPGMPWDPNV